jgi:hypothetical protein
MRHNQINTMSNLTNVYTPAGGSETTEVYRRFREEPDRVDYTCVDSTAGLRNSISFMRVGPKRNASFLGVHRMKIRLVVDEMAAKADGSESVQPCTVEMSFMVPAGSTEAQRLQIAARTSGLTAGTLRTVVDDFINHQLLPA